jgi:hypothetical protein
MNMPHKHYVEIMQFAIDASQHDKPWELWEKRHISSGLWSDCNTIPSWTNTFEYRRKKQYIVINGIKVPKPLDVRPARGQKYYFVSINRQIPVAHTYWSDDPFDHKIFSNGTAHLEEQDARIHGEALLSFTNRTKED